MTEPRKSIDECSGEEWNAAAKRHWDWIKETKTYEEDPVYSSREDKIIADRLIEDEEDIFGGSLFDKADEAEEINTQDAVGLYEMEEWLNQEEILDEVVKCLGDWDAIAYCQGTVLRIMMDHQSITNKNAIAVAKRHLDRLSRLVHETEGVNW
jgi:hypothetical protein